MATLAGSKTITLAEMSQEINLKRYIGKDVTDDQKRLFLELAIDYINNRTLDGKELGGSKSFVPYSEEYADKKGVSRFNVDLFLEGDMLESIDGEPSNGNNVKIKLEGDLQTKKGFNHQTGDTLPKRPWFGLTADETKALANIVKESSGSSNNDSSGDDGTFTLAELNAAINSLGIKQVI